MKKILKYIIAGATIIGLGFSQQAIGAVLQGFQGGTGISTSTAGNDGMCLVESSSSPFLTWSVGSCGSGGSFNASGTPWYITGWNSSGTSLLATTSLYFSSTTGNIGVNSLNPTAVFTVGEYGTLSPNLTTSSFAVTANTNAAGGAQFYNMSTGTAAEFRFAVFDTNKTGYITVDAPGSGNTAQLFGAGRSSSFFLFSNAGSRALTIGTVDNQPLYFGTNNTRRVTVASSGVVTINTSTVILGNISSTQVNAVAYWASNGELLTTSSLAANTLIARGTATGPAITIATSGPLTSWVCTGSTCTETSIPTSTILLGYPTSTILTAGGTARGNGVTLATSSLPYFDINCTGSTCTFTGVATSSLGLPTSTSGSVSLTSTYIGFGNSANSITGVSTLTFTSSTQQLNLSSASSSEVIGTSFATYTGSVSSTLSNVTSVTLSYSGVVQYLVITSGGAVSATTTALGAKGGDGNGANAGGKGGSATGTIIFQPNTPYYYCVGGQGNSQASGNGTVGGFCGGGTNGGGGVGSGGGASWIATQSTISVTTSTDLIVGGGGGGAAGNTSTTGGAGGGLTGNAGTGNAPGQGGTQTAGGANGGAPATNGSMGQGGNGDGAAGGGGGGGYFGGGGGFLSGGSGAGGGGGSSGFGASVTNTTTTANVNNSTGSITLSFASPVTIQLITPGVALSNASHTETLQVAGHIRIGGAFPSTSACGAASIAGSDSVGSISLPVSTTTCQLNFAQSWVNTPVCTANVASGTNAYLKIQPTTTTVQFTASTAMGATAVINYICIGY